MAVKTIFSDDDNLHRIKEEIEIMLRARNEFMVQLIDFAILDIKGLQKSFLIDLNEKDPLG